MSADPVPALAKWAAREEIPYPLLSDEGTETLEEWGVWGEKTFMGKRYRGVSRATFLLDSRGKVARAWPKVAPLGHAKEVSAALVELASRGG